MSTPDDFQCPGLDVEDSREPFLEGVTGYKRAYTFPEVIAYEAFRRSFAQEFRDFEELSGPEIRRATTHTNERLKLVFRALHEKFMNLDGGHRMPDGLLITTNGLHAELLEVTSDQWYRTDPEKRKQVGDELRLLNVRVNGRLREFNEPIPDRMPGPYVPPVKWVGCPAKRRPSPNLKREHMYYDRSPQDRKWVCFRPSYREPVPEDGVVLYEIHKRGKRERRERKDRISWLEVMITSALLSRFVEGLKNHTPPNAEGGSADAPAEWGRKVVRNDSSIAAMVGYVVAAVGVVVAVILLAPEIAAALSVAGAWACCLAFGLVTAVEEVAPALLRGVQTAVPILGLH